MELEENMEKVLESMVPGQEYTRKEVQKLCAEVLGLDHGEAYSEMRKLTKILGNPRRGYYTLPSDEPVHVQPEPVKAAANVIEMPKAMDTEPLTSLIPTVVSEYVAWGNFSKVRKIIQSKQFIPSFITGLSGNGKTMMVNQACAKEKREMIRVQITPETDEDDLLGGFRLVDGNTVFEKGPVVVAMERGAILLLDEIDRGTNRLMCLQGVLEGEPVLLKKIKEVVAPAPGFNIIATANTKGQGSESGKFIAATVIDEAFLERFTLTLEQDYPTAAVEENILLKHFNKYDIPQDRKFVNRLITWSHSVRKLYNEGQIEELISTRRLCHIIQTYSIFGDAEQAVDLCLARFDSDTSDAIKSYYSKLVESEQKAEPKEDDSEESSENPFD